MRVVWVLNRINAERCARSDSDIAENEKIPIYDDEMGECFLGCGTEVEACACHGWQLEKCYWLLAATKLLFTELRLLHWFVLLRLFSGRCERVATQVHPWPGHTDLHLSKGLRSPIQLWCTAQIIIKCNNSLNRLSILWKSGQQLIASKANLWTQVHQVQLPITVIT